MTTVGVPREFMRAAACELDDFRAIVEQDSAASDYPHASEIAHRTVVYDSTRLEAQLSEPHQRLSVMSEIAGALMEGPGIVMFRGALPPEAVDRATAAFETIIEEQRASGTAAGEHYAKPGANDRIWNALEKLAVRDPDAFVDYYANDIIAIASEAWLGPGYLVTSQVNVVNPGGEAQQPHRDYHLGFLTDEQAERYPRHVHRLSPALTLQGAVAHCDMAVESGPTMYLPHSHKYEAGYLAWRRPEFKDYFARHRVQLPLAKGDAVFFNPALFHAAGTNRTTEVRRMANLLQISSAFGRPMEAVDFTAMARAVFPALLRARAGGRTGGELGNAIAATTNGYPFPTNLDVDQPIGGLAPPSQADVLRQAVEEAWPPARLTQELAEHSRRRQAS